MTAVLLFAGLMAAGTVTSSGAAFAADKASNSPPYGTGGSSFDWTTTTNGGFGFTGWNFGGASSGHDIQTSSTAIDTSGVSFALSTTDAVRRFTAGGENGNATLGVGQKFSIDLDFHLLGGSGGSGFARRGFELRSDGQGLGTRRLGLWLNPNNLGSAPSDYERSIWDPSFGDVNYHTGISPTSSGLHVVFEQRAANGFSIAITPYGGPNAGMTTILTDATTRPLAAADLHVLNVHKEGNGTVFFNSMSIVPEPSACAMLAFASLAALSLYRARGVTGRGIDF